MTGSTSPLFGEAVERLAEEVRDYLDGPVAHLRISVDHATSPGYDAKTAAADAARGGLLLARAWISGINAMTDVLADLAEPPVQDTSTAGPNDP